jgi:hypothetical protein
MTNMNSSSQDSRSNFSTLLSAQLSNTSQTIVVIFWALVTLTSLVSLSLSVYALNLWDRLPAADLSKHYPDMTVERLEFLSAYKDTVIETGLSLSNYAMIFSAARLIGGLALLTVSALLIRRYSNRPVAVLMAIFLSAFAAAGIWYNLLFDWAVSIVPWMEYPVQALGLLMWGGGAFAIYTFPDGRFVPRWMAWLVAAIIPLAFLLVLNIDIFLNPNTWPGLLYLLPNILFVGGALISILYRQQEAGHAQKRAMLWYVSGAVLLVVIYFINLAMTDVYYSITGQSLFQSNSAVLAYVLINEPLWYAIEVFFAVGLALSVFRGQLLEE